VLDRFKPILGIAINREHWMLYEFKKRYHLYSSVLPAPSDNVEWLALMQHHGAPTRLLDFTDSFYVAVHFAIVDRR
jgi:FRG domain